MTDNSNEIKISGEMTLDPQVCKFIVNRPFLSEGSFNCRNKEMTKGSPLLEALFEIDGISQVFVSGNTLTIAKTSSNDWPALGKQIGPIIRDQINSKKEMISADVDKLKPSEESIREQIQELFDKEINPSIASHGGMVELASVEGTTVSLRLGGGCQGCASANQTLKLGIEKAIRQTVPEVTEVIDVTDHATGVDPYYK